MEKMRSIKSKFWDDPWVLDLDPIEKLLFLYLLTNHSTNLAGIYELHIRKMAFETGIDREMILKILQRFQDDKKAFYHNGWVIIVNFVKNQKYNPSMIANVKKILDALPDNVKNTQPINSLLQPVYSLLQVEGEGEGEVEGEDESEGESEKIPAWDDFKAYAIENDKKVNLAALENKYKGWIENDWKTNGEKPRPIKNWKTTLLNTLAYLPKEGGQKFTADDFEDGTGESING